MSFSILKNFGRNPPQNSWAAGIPATSTVHDVAGIIAVIGANAVSGVNSVVSVTAVAGTLGVEYI